MTGHTAYGPIDLSLGEPGYPPPTLVQLAASRAIEQGVGGYAPMGGAPALRVALAHKLRTANRLPAAPEQVVVTNGASQAVFATLATVCRPGDRVLVPQPGFPLYRLAASTLNLTVAGYPIRAERRHEPDWDVLSEQAGDARVLLWNFPSNPVGAVAQAAWYDRLYELLSRFPRLTVLSDEVYEDLWFDQPQLGPAATAGDLAKRFVSLFSFSKSHALVGWRVGYLHTTTQLAESIARRHWGISMSSSSVGQVAALAALRAPADALDTIRALLRRQRDHAVAKLRAAGLDCEVPAAGFYLWLDVSGTGIDGVEWVRRCAATCQVRLSPGIQFDPTATTRVRFCFAAARPVLDEALDRIVHWSSIGWEDDPDAARATG